MSKIKHTVTLKKVAIYSKKRIDCVLLNSENFIGTDNLQQNKTGKTKALYAPINGTVTKYDCGDILIANIRPYLKKIWYATNTGGSSADVLTLVVNKEFDSKFVYYNLFKDDFFNHMMVGSKGTKMPRGDKNQVLCFPIPEFLLNEQKKIAHILSTLDAKIELNNKISAELEKMAKTLYDYWFVQFDFPDENGKPYKSSGGKMVFDKKLKREIPDGWEIKRLVDEMDVQYGYPFSTTQFNEEGLGIPVIRIRDILNNTASLYSTETADDKYRLKKGDLLIGMDGNFHLNFWDKNDCFLNQRSVRIRKQNKSTISQFQTLFSIEPYIKAREKNVSRTTVGHLSAKDINALNILIPSSSEVIEKCKLFDSTLEQLIVNRNENQKLAELRDWLLPMLMNGQVEVV